MSQAAVSILRATILNAVAANMLSDDRYPATAPTLTDFLNWMSSTETRDDGDVEDIRIR
jgi:hypothetical protein